MSSPRLLRAAALANADAQTTNETANSVRHSAALIPLPFATPRSAGSDPMANTALLIHDDVTIRRPAIEMTPLEMSCPTARG